MVISIGATLLASTGCVASEKMIRGSLTLADQGSLAAKTAASSLGGTLADVDTYLESQYFLAGLRKTGEPTGLVENMAPVQASLAARVALLDNLAAAYGALKALASYDASGQLSDAAGGTIGAANALAEAIQKGGAPAFPPDRTTLVTNLFGEVGAAAQRDKLDKAHVALNALLRDVIALFEREKGIYASVNGVLAQTAGGTALELWNLNLGNPDAVLAPLFGSFGIVYNPKQLGAPEKISAEVKSGVEMAVRYRVMRFTRLREASIDTTIRALKSLAHSHDELARSGELTLADATGEIKLLQHYVELMRAVAEEAKQTKGND